MNTDKGYIPYDMVGWVNSETGEPIYEKPRETNFQKIQRVKADEERKEAIKHQKVADDYERRLQERITILKERIAADQEEMEKVETALKVHREMRY